MPQDLAIVDQLYDLVLDESKTPCGSLLDDGVFPGGWVDEYLQLLEKAKQEWHGEDRWPRKLFVAVHFASWYLEIRYKVWCVSTGKKNPDTERQLNGIRSPSELFLLDGVVGNHSAIRPEEN